MTTSKEEEPRKQSEPSSWRSFARCGAWCERLDEKDVHDQNFVISLERWV